jgi:Spy/CpxP family protein refolding chaperone
MKKIVLGMMAVALTFTAIAQKDGSSNKNKNHEKESTYKKSKGSENFDKLNLTDAQKAQMKTINQNFRQQMQDLKKQGNITVDQQTQRREAIAKEHRAKIQAILTPEQRDQAANYKKDFKEGRKENGRDDRFEEITKDLNLTPDQSAKMSSINASFRTSLQNIRQNSTLGENEKREQMKKLMKQHRSDMEALLTNDQKEQLKSRQKNRPNRSAVK